MDLGVPELILIVMVFGIAFLVLTVYACVRASQNGDSGWVIAILAGWIFGAGWIVGLVYLLTQDGPRRAELGAAPSLPPPSGPPVAGPATTPAAWYDDPSGRFDHRYWDGDRWTADVTRDGRQQTDPAGTGR